MRRWLTPVQLGEHLAQRSPRVAKLNHKRRREYAVRAAKRLEKLSETTLIKRVGVNILVSWKAIELLHAPDITTVDEIDKGMAEINHKVRGLVDRTNAHASHIRDHSLRIVDSQRRLTILEEKEAARRRFEAEIQGIESRNRAAG